MADYAIPKNGVAYILYTGLTSQANPLTLKSGPTLASGDFKVSIDGGAFANLATLPTNTPSGVLVKISLSAAEMTGDNISVACIDAAGAEWCDQIINIQTSARGVADLAYPATSGRSMVVDAAGLVDANAVKLGPTGSGTAQTARDIGTSVLISSGTGTGQLNVSSGVIQADAAKIGGQTASASGTITFPNATLASTTNITAGIITTVTTVTNQLTAGAIATGVWTDTTAGDFTTALSIGKSIMNGVTLGTGLTINSYTGNTVQTGDNFARIGAAGAGLTALGDSRIANLDATVSSRTKPADTQAAVTLVTTTTNLTNAPTAGDFTATMKTSIGTAVAASAVASVTAGVTLAASQHVIVDSGTITTLTNLPAAPTDWLAAAAVKADAVTKIQSGLSTYAGGDTTGVTTLLARVPTFPTNFSALALTAGGKVSGVVLTDTCTTNTDMRGTDSALLAASYTAPLSAAGTRTALGMSAANLDSQLAAIDADVLARLATSGYTAPPSVASIAAGLLDLANGVETGVTPRQALRAIAAALAGKRSAAGTTSEQYDAIGVPGTARIVGNMDVDGNGTPTLSL